MSDAINKSAPGVSSPQRGAALALGLLLAINLFNYIDRQILSAVLPEIERAFGCSKAELGMLTSVFLISYMVVSPVFGWLGDRFSRWKLIAIGVVLWSLASGGTGLAATFGVMALTRALIGVGEGAYGPVAPSLISDLYPVEHRGAKLAWFYVAIPVGSALGYVFGGWISGMPNLGWRWAFYLVVPPGILLGLLSLLMREPARGLADGVAHRHARFSDYGTLLRTPSYVLCTLGMTAMTFAVGGMAVWIPTFYFERESVYVIQASTLEQLKKEHPAAATTIGKLQTLQGQEFHGMDALRGALRQVMTMEEVLQYRAPIAWAARDKERSFSLSGINTTFGGITVVTGLAATLMGGWLGDRLRPRYGGSYFLVSGAGMLLGFPAFLAALVVPLPHGWVFVFIGVFFLFFNTGPANTILANVAHPSVRSSAFALNILIIHLFGDVASPPIVGWVDDHSSLVTGMYVLSGAILISGVLWLWGARYLARDTALAPTRL